MQSFGKIVTWAGLTIVGLVVAIFSWDNRAPVAVSLAPVSWTTTELPLFIVLLAMFVFGLLVGMIVAWGAGHAGRRLSAERRRQIRELEKQLGDAAPPRARQDVIEHAGPGTAIAPRDAP